MTNYKKPVLAVTFLASTLTVLPLLAEESTTRYSNTFDTNDQAEIPTSWMISETSSTAWLSASKTVKLADWGITRDSNASSGKNILTIKKLNKSSSGVYNLIYTSKVKFLQGEISVKIRADSGVIDQGGGPMWRVKDENNYYVARYNPLESNFRVYYVKDGKRIQLQSAENINIKKGEWFTIKVQHKDNHIVGWLNGKELLSVRDDTHNASGGVGLWTKADAVSAFDDFNVNSL